MTEPGSPASTVVRFLAAGCVTLPLLGAVLAFASAVAGAPPEHEVLSRGGHSIAYRSAYTPNLFGPIAPTTSLAGARCEAWLQLHTEACPDTALPSQFWPELQDTPDSLYVGVLAYCDMMPEHFNVEVGDGTILTLHCHWSAPWINLTRPPMGVVGQPITQLVVVSTAGWTPGKYWVYREDRVERWLSDQVETSLLGAVDIGKQA